jgi:predicted amidophosphoribosyltransferase
LRGDWRELTDDASVDLSGDACPACGSSLPLVDGACADCGLQLE